MRAVVIFLGLLALSYASCPNQCSGHGRCGANDKCECYTQQNTPWGNRPMYSGADCSLRTCPLGSAADAIANHFEGIAPIALSKAGAAPLHARGFFDYALDSTTTLKVYLDQELMLPGPSVTINLKFTNTPGGAASGKSYFVWKYSSDSVYSPVQIPITGRVAGAEPSDQTDVMLLHPPQALGTYPTNNQIETGIRVWINSANSLFDGDEYTFTVNRGTGYHWIGSNDNTLHQARECSHRGTCDSATGKCKCFVGFGGEACQRTECPNSCSGHGVCQDQFHFRADADSLDQVSNNFGHAYGTYLDLFTEPFDAHRAMGCKCDIGYRGPDCSLIECPSGGDPLTTSSAEEGNEIARDCSGRGICDYSVGQCKCFKGYFGERCESQTNFV